MKTKKVLALIVSAVMILSLLPAMAFGVSTLRGVTTGTNPNINTYGSVVEGPDGSVSAQSIGDINGNNDGAEFNLTIISDTPFAAGDTIYVASRRYSVDYFYYKDAAGDWVPFGGYTGDARDMQQQGNTYAMEITYNDMLRLVGGSTTVATATIKVVSTATGTSQIVFGRDADDTATYARGTTPTGGLSNIIGTRTFPAEFTAPKANGLLLTGARTAGGTGSVYANNVDTYTVTAYVTTLRDGGGLPVSGTQVNFSVLSGTGATLTATSVTTNVSGRAETKVYSSRADSITITATVSGINPYTVGEFYVAGGMRDSNYRDRVVLPFGSTGIVSIRPESGDNQKVARDAGGTKWFRFSAYDANGTRLDFNRIIPAIHKVSEYTPLGTNRWNVTAWMKGSIDTGPEMQATIVTSPSGAAIRAGDIIYRTHPSGDAEFGVSFDRLNRDGRYEIRIYLINGVSVTMGFDVKDLGTVTAIRLSYPSNSYAAGTVVPEPDVFLQDTDGYELRRGFGHSSWGGNIALSISDASFMSGAMDPATGSFSLKDDKSGQITMTVVDKTRNMVGSYDLTITKTASYLKLTPTSVGAVGGEVTVNIELVDVDGVLAATGLGVRNSEDASAAIVSRPDGSIASVSAVDFTDFNQGKSNVKVSCNAEGDVIVRVIITEERRPKPGKIGDPYLAATPLDDWYGGRTYTGVTTVSFGRSSGAGGTLIFIIGAPSYVVGNQAFIAESPAFIENGRTFLGVRDIGNAINGQIEWDQATQTATVSKNGIVVKITVGASNIAITKSGVTSEEAIDAPAQNRAGRVYLPFRALLEAFGYSVEWDQATQAIICTV